MEGNELNAATIDRELGWLSKLIEARFEQYFKAEKVSFSVLDIPAPEVSEDPSQYATLIKKFRLGSQERVCLILALAPTVRPQLLDVFFTKNADTDRGFTEFGGIKGKNHGGFVPTGETASFVIAGRDVHTRIELLNLFSPDHIFYKEKILVLGDAKDFEPQLSGMLQLSQDYTDLFTLGKARKPLFSAKFPAAQIETHLEWNDLVLHTHAKSQVQNILDWIEYQELILNEWNMKKVIKPGYRALFYGPPGTGKTLTASLLGKSTGKDVYRVDVSMVVSKWVGETEKNLARVFDMAENKGWILFFDEADSLFGKRGEGGSGQDRYANQEISYLLQRTEEYPGVVILASNLKGNIDEAFSRRFQSMVHFQMPNTKERQLLWEKAFSSILTIEEEVDIGNISKSYELSGGAIVNALKYCATKSAANGTTKVTSEILIDGIRYELNKQGKTT